tara:strand:+ start:381 stop:809 length:429 start_codon:yes stop_codon:yes gene_type:complete
MPLPSSGQMTMNAVKTEFSSSQSANLSLKGFGAALSTPVTSNIALAASFYGQSAVTLTSFTAQLNSEGGTFEDSESACNAEEVTQHTYYHDGSGTLPAEDDHVYTNSGGTTDAPDGYIRFSPGRGNQVTNIESGVAGLTGIC